MGLMDALKGLGSASPLGGAMTPPHSDPTYYVQQYQKQIAMDWARKADSAEQKIRRQEAALPHRSTTEAVVGWRAWRIARDDNGEPVLMSLVKDVPWDGPVHRADQKPGLGDNYGIHSFRLTRLNTEYDTAQAEGEVLLYGKVIVFEKGIRAECAMIRRLVLYPGGWMEETRPMDMHTLVKQYMLMSLYAPYSLPKPEVERTGRMIYSYRAKEKAGLAENAALAAALEQRYECEVAFIPRVTQAELDAEREPRPKKKQKRIIRKPTKKELKWISESR